MLHEEQNPESGGSSFASTFQSPINNSDTRHLFHGSAADIWLISTNTASKRVWKVLRVDPERLKGIKTKNIHDSNSQRGSELWMTFFHEYSSKVRAWQMLNHPNVVQVFGFGDGLNLEVDYYENGCLRDFLKSCSEEANKIAMAQDIIAGVQYLHNHDPPVIHGSLNAGKCFVDRDGTIRVGEFGLTTLCYPFASYVPSISCTGLNRWLSPEIVEAGRSGLSVGSSTPVIQPTAASDVWALGCTLYEVLAQQVPYSQHKREIAVLRAIMAGISPCQEDSTFNSPTSELFWPIIRSCWRPTLEDRPNISRISRELTAHLLSKEGIPHARPNQSSLQKSFEEAFFLPTAELSPRTLIPHIFTPSEIPEIEASSYTAADDQALLPQFSDPLLIPMGASPKRRRVSTAQLRGLNEIYSRTMFPSTEERAEVAHRLGMTLRQVQIWFQNRRQLTRQAQVLDSPSFDPEYLPSQPGLSTGSDTTEGSSLRMAPAAETETLNDYQEDVFK